LPRFLKSLSLEPQRHGGDKADVCKTLGIDPADFIDLSTGLSPFRPVPRAVLEKALDKLGDYSDPCGRSAARAVAALTGVPEECVSVGNGSTELFYAVVRVLEKRRCADSSEIALGSPTFGEIRLAAEVAGLKPAEVVWGGSDLSFDVPEASRILQRSGFGIFFDPTPVVGLAVPEEMREALVSSGLVVWDEAYYALSTGRWLSRWERQARDGVTIIVSSLTKTLSLPGLRAGFFGGESGNRSGRRRGAPRLASEPDGDRRLGVFAGRGQVGRVGFSLHRAASYLREDFAGRSRARSSTGRGALLGCATTRDGSGRYGGKGSDGGRRCGGARLLELRRFLEAVHPNRICPILCKSTRQSGG
jgi:hypothetical protein